VVILPTAHLLVGAEGEAMDTFGNQMVDIQAAYSIQPKDQVG
tara:strand:+ start:194 stop:319 length:126 start_codon:yes stop_codon:yes gene_type:complete